MSLLLHCCCGPCAMYPIKSLIDDGYDLSMFWYNPNIHPEFEWNRRLDNLKKVSEHYNLELLIKEGFMQEHWESKKYLEEYKSRCQMCYDIRLEEVAKYASDNGFDSFTTSLLVSPYQQHDVISSIAEEKGNKYGVEFKYFNFRPGFREGQNMAREIGLYRQKYCGCIFSLEESDFKEKILKSFEA